MQKQICVGVFAGVLTLAFNGGAVAQTVQAGERFFVEALKNSIALEPGWRSYRDQRANVDKTFSDNEQRIRADRYIIESRRQSDLDNNSANWRLKQTALNEEFPGYAKLVTLPLRGNPFASLDDILNDTLPRFKITRKDIDFDSGRLFSYRTNEIRIGCGYKFKLPVLTQNLSRNIAGDLPKGTAAAVYLVWDNHVYDRGQQIFDAIRAVDLPSMTKSSPDHYRLIYGPIETVIHLWASTANEPPPNYKIQLGGSTGHRTNAVLVSSSFSNGDIVEGIKSFPVLGDLMDESPSPRATSSVSVCPVR